jgi:hypothetical protein
LNLGAFRLLPGHKGVSLLHSESMTQLNSAHVSG